MNLSRRPSIRVVNQSELTRRRHAHNFYVLGRQRAEDGAWDEARALLLRALSFDADCAPALRAIAGVEFTSENFALAKQYLERALLFDPGDPEALQLRGNMALTEGNPRGALDAYQQVEASAGSSADLTFNIGLAHLLLGNGEEAVASFAKLLTEDSENPRIWDALGCAQRLVKNHSAALQAFLRALEIDPKLNDARDHLAELLLETGNPQQAQQVLRTALAQEPKRHASRHLLGMAYAATQQFQKAAECWTAIIADRVAQAETYHLLANAYLHLNEQARAMRVLEVLVMQYPDHLPGHLQLALLLLENGYSEQGWHHLERARALDPLNPTVTTAFTAARAISPVRRDSEQ